MSENFLVKKYKEKVELLENNSILVNINDWKKISQFIFKSKFKSGFPSLSMSSPIFFSSIPISYL